MGTLLDLASLVVVPSGYKEDKIYSVVPTDGSGDLDFTRASNATRVNSAGLIEKVRTNELTDSQDFSNWTQAAVTITTSATANPLDGLLNAQDITPTATTSIHRILKTCGPTNSLSTWSIYAKAKGYNFITIVENGDTGASVSFNLSTGLVSTELSAVGQIQSLGNGWYRCSMILTTLTSPRFDVFVSPTDSQASYTADGTSGVTLFGAQTETGDIATDYIPTTTAAVSVGMTADVPRLDYLGSSCPSLLLEPQRTSNSQFSESFDNAYWTKTNVTLTSTLGGPIDQSKYFTITCDGTVGTFKGVGKTFINASANTYTLSVFAKAGNSSTFVISSRATLTTNDVRAIFNLSNGTITDSNGGTATITPYGDGWYRCTFTIVNAGTFTNQASIFFGHPHGAANGATLLATGAMSEIGAYPTSYIPTLGTSVTRVAENNVQVNPSTLVGATTGSWFIDVEDFEFVTIGTIIPTTFIGDSETDYIGLTARTVGFDGIVFVKRESGTTTTIYSTANKTLKAFFSWNGANLKLFVDGVKVYDDNSFANFAAWDIFQLNYATREAQYKLNQTLLFPTALTDDQAIQLTA